MTKQIDKLILSLKNNDCNMCAFAAGVIEGQTRVIDELEKYKKVIDEAVALDDLIRDKQKLFDQIEKIKNMIKDK